MRKITIKNVQESRDIKLNIGMPGLFFGDSSDGDFETTGDTYFPSELDGEVITKNFNNFTINEGHLVTTSHRCKGLVIKCQGNCTIDGTLSMTARGGRGEGRLWGPAYFDQVNTIDGVLDLRIGATGGAGGSRASSGSYGVISYRAGNSGYSGKNGACGGGGSGRAFRHYGPALYSGAGSPGTTWSGGSGGGGIDRNCSTSAYCSGQDKYAGNGNSNGGKGGNGSANQLGWGRGGGGGAGNPGGIGQSYNNGWANNGQSGTGGLLILIVKGFLIINGEICSKGSNGGSAHRSGGGSSGGGSITILSPTITNNGTIQANGGSSISGGGAGGAGSIRIHQLLG